MVVVKRGSGDFVQIHLSVPEFCSKVAILQALCLLLLRLLPPLGSDHVH